MQKKVTCPCGKSPLCKLCSETGFYLYELGPRGWIPFSCPTCDGKGQIPGSDNQLAPCPTCHGAGKVDPAEEKNHGLLDVIWKALFGA